MARKDYYDYTASNFKILDLSQFTKNYIRLSNNIETRAGSRYIYRIEPPKDVYSGYELTIHLGCDSTNPPIKYGTIGLLLWPHNYSDKIPVTAGKSQVQNILFPMFTPTSSPGQFAYPTGGAPASLLPTKVHGDFWNEQLDSTEYSITSKDYNFNTNFMEYLSHYNATHYSSNGSSSSLIVDGTSPSNIIFHGSAYVTYDRKKNLFSWSDLVADSVSTTDNLKYYAQSTEKKMQAIAFSEKIIKLRYIENYVPYSPLPFDGYPSNTPGNFWIVENIIIPAIPTYDLTGQVKP
ncbi:MAG: hypothetical protein M0R51_01155 [Clostridia bacterium]|jgi:hypothetical protein|nr:hypothetical protein [Clostridia bacterium]